MRNSLIAALIVTVLMVVPTASFANGFGDVTTSGYMALDAPMHQGETYKVRWANVDFTGVPVLQPNMQVRIQFNFASLSPSYLYTKRVDSVLGGEFVSMGGKVLSRIGDLMPGPNSIRTIRWEKAYSQYDVKSFGLSASFEKNAFKFGMVHAENSSAAVTVYGVSTFWQEDAGYGFTMKLPLQLAWTESRVTASFPEDGMEQFSVLTCINPSGKLTFNYIADIGSTNALTFGFTYEYSTKSFVKAYFDIEEGVTGEFDLELVCSF